MSAATAVPTVPTSQLGLRPEIQLDPTLLALYRRSSPEAKLAIVHRLNVTLIGLKEANLVATRPDWTCEMRRNELRRWWLTAHD